MSDYSQTRILLATDGSKASFHAAERAVHLAGYSARATLPVSANKSKKPSSEEH